MSSGLDYARIRSSFFLLFRKGKQAHGDCVWEAWRGATRVQVTWGDEEGPPQLLVPCHIPDLLGHVDHPAGHGGDPAEVQDPGRKVTGKGSNLRAPARTRLAWNEYPSLHSEAGSPTPWTLGTEPGGHMALGEQGPVERLTHTVTHHHPPSSPAARGRAETKKQFCLVELSQKTGDRGAGVETWVPRSHRGPRVYILKHSDLKFPALMLLPSLPSRYSQRAPSILVTSCTR